jgi:hypothetical protein
MRSKTILSTAAFIVAFAASAAFANLFITKTQTVSDYGWASSYKSTSCFKNRNNSTTANKISALIREDKSNGRASGNNSYRVGEDVRPPFNVSNFSEYAEAVERYVDNSSSMKASDLPNDFRVEWRAHMKAWRDYSDFLNRMKESSNRAALSGEEIEAASRSSRATRHTRQSGYDFDRR